MPTGSCFCEKIKVEYSGEPAMTVSMHYRYCSRVLTDIVPGALSLQRLP